MADEPTLNDQMVEPAISDEDMQAFINSLEGAHYDQPLVNFAEVGPQGEETPDNADDEPNGDDAETPDEEAEEEPTPAESFIINGQPVARADLERLYEFDQYMRTNPDVAQRVSAAMAPPAPTEQPPVPPAPAAETPSDFVTPTPPEGFDLDDPQIKFLWDQNVATQKQIWEQGRQVASFTAATQKQNQNIIDAQARTDMDSALSAFRAEYPGLNDDDIASIRQEAAPLLPGLMAKKPPIEALGLAMKAAAYMNADLHTKLNAETPQPTERQKSNSRKQRLGSIAGAPRSAPKVEPRPEFRSDRDMVNALAQEFADQMGR